MAQEGDDNEGEDEDDDDERGVASSKRPSCSGSRGAFTPSPVLCNCPPTRCLGSRWASCGS